MDDPDMIFEQFLNATSTICAPPQNQITSSSAVSSTVQSTSLFDDLIHSSVFGDYGDFDIINTQSSHTTQGEFSVDVSSTAHTESHDLGAVGEVHSHNGTLDRDKMQTDLSGNNCEADQLGKIANASSVMASDDSRFQNGKDQSSDDINANDILNNQTMPPIDIVIQNVVSSFSTRCHLNLKKLASESVNVIYKRQQSMVQMKLRKPPITASIWASGKVSVTGARSEDEAKVAARRVARLVQRAGFAVKFCNFRIVNVLGTCTLSFGIHIADFSREHRQNASYEPELHPGVTYRIKEPKATAKIFSTGSITVTAPRVTNVLAAIEHLYPLVRQFQRSVHDAAIASMPTGLHLLPAASGLKMAQQRTAAVGSSASSAVASRAFTVPLPPQEESSDDSGDDTDTDSD